LAETGAYIGELGKSLPEYYNIFHLAYPERAMGGRWLSPGQREKEAWQVFSAGPYLVNIALSKRGRKGKELREKPIRGFSRFQ
jgi:hypothetical protein